MSFVLADRVRETTSTTGTGTIALGGAVTGFRTFVAGIGDTNETYYCISHRTADEWEVGVGTVSDATPDTLSRDTILASTNSGAAVDFSAGTKDVRCVHPADRTIYADDDGTVSIDSILKLLERSSDPDEPAEGEAVIWMSDGTGKGDYGDVLIASRAGGTTKWGTLFDHWGGSDW
jgi:hypothetical protein